MSQVLMSRFDREDVLASCAAELAIAAYRVVLRTKTEETWLDLELDLWKALADTLKTSERNCLSLDFAVPIVGEAAGTAPASH